jgi:hypothetical protein
MNTDGAAVPEDEKPAEMPSAADIVSFRVEALREAARIISNDRNGQYGDPEDNFGKIAEYYAHAEPNIQRLMENSALVIIDFDKAIENGFVKLSDAISNLVETEEKNA